MDNTIKITKDLIFDFDDLMKDIDFRHEFTLRDVLRSCMNSKIPLDILQPLLRCNYIKDYWEEAESKEFKEDMGGMEFLEVYWEGSCDKDEEEEICSSGWSFHGYGVDKDEGFSQGYAIEFSPMYDLAGFPIKIKKEMRIEDWNGSDFEYKDIDFVPSITLVEFLYAIFWEFSFVGSPEQRNIEMKKIDEACNEIDEALKNGNIDEITTPHNEVKKIMEDKFKNDKES